MVTFVGTRAGKGTDLLSAFAIHGIDGITINGNEAVVVQTMRGPDLKLTYVGSGFTESGDQPTGGTFHSVVVERGGVKLGTLTGIAPEAAFTDILSYTALNHIFDGDDTLTGGRLGDVLDGGAGNNSFTGKAGNDTFRVEGASGTPAHQFDGGKGLDAVGIDALAGPWLDLRASTFKSIEWLGFDPGTIKLSGSQFGHGGIALSAHFESFEERDEDRSYGRIEVYQDVAGKLDLSQLKLHDPFLYVYGSAGDDTIRGTGYDDGIVGGDGNDIITGNRGEDDLTGGGGADTFDYNAANESGRWETDSIADFDPLLDRIDLKTIDANTDKKGNQAFKFVEAGGFTHNAGEVIWKDFGGGYGYVDADVNGDSRYDLRVAVQAVLALTADDFVL